MKLSFQIQGFFLYPDMKEFFSSENLHLLFPLVPAGCFFASGGQLIQLDRSRSQTCTMIFFFLSLRDVFLPPAASLFSWTEAGHRPHHDLFFLSLRDVFCLRRPAYSAGPKQVTDLHHDLFFLSLRDVFLPPAASLFSWTEAGHRPAP